MDGIAGRAEIQQLAVTTYMKRGSRPIKGGEVVRRAGDLIDRSLDVPLRGVAIVFRNSADTIVGATSTTILLEGYANPVHLKN